MSSTCAIVGAGEGLGAALARKFSSEGMDIALISRSEAGSADALTAARDAQPSAKVQFYRADATDPETIEMALGAVAGDFGDIDVLIYNVRDAFTMIEPLEMSYASLENIFKLEVVGAFAAAKAVLPSMRERGQGSIFFSSSTAAFRGSGKLPLYAIGKFGLRALSQSLTRAYAKDGVHIVHVRLDCDLDVPVMHERYGDAYNPDMLAQPEDVAQTYWHTHLQPRSAWSNEIELRPYSETWTF
jgi:NAD(P)-dependent dehydrogenase (short-subunit alcohol dehydrogenase family)